MCSSSPRRSYVEQLRDAYSWQESEAQRYGGRLLPIQLTPYIMGLPYRIDALESLLSWLDAQPAAWIARGDAILDAWAASERRPNLPP